jgi:hypothetical protein
MKISLFCLYAQKCLNFESVNAYVKGDAVVLVNRATNEIVIFLNKKGGRLSSKFLIE